MSFNLKERSANAFEAQAHTPTSPEYYHALGRWEMPDPTPRAELFWGQSRVVGDRQTDRADWRIVGREDEAEDGRDGAVEA